MRRDLGNVVPKNQNHGIMVGKQGLWGVVRSEGSMVAAELTIETESLWCA